VEKLKADKYIIDFDQLDEEWYSDLVMWGILMARYPFCTGLGFQGDLAIYQKLIRQRDDAKIKVKKKSNKPFKSRKKVNTVLQRVQHPITGNIAFTFEEDDSIVEVRMCEEVK